MDEQQTANMGVEAAQVLANPAFNEALRLMKEDVHRRWKECPIRDREGQMLLLQAARITESVESVLRGMLEAGKLANAKIDIENSRSESRVKRTLRAIG